MSDPNKQHTNALSSLPSMDATEAKPFSGFGSANGGNNSDNSAISSFGARSFEPSSLGFAFDEEIMSNSTPRNSMRNGCSSDSDNNCNWNDTNYRVVSSSSDRSKSNQSDVNNSEQQQETRFPETETEVNNRYEPVHNNNTSAVNTATSAQSRAKTLERERELSDGGSSDNGHNASDYESFQRPVRTVSNSVPRKRKVLSRSDDSCGGYNSDDELDEDKKVKSSGCGSSCRTIDTVTSCDSKSTSQQRKTKRKKNSNDSKRKERNAREKERSFKISKQINELRDVLSNGGVIVPKGTKSSVLTEAANYIRMLQQHQCRSEIDRSQLVQQMQLIGGGAHGPQAAAVIRHVAAKNGVWSLGNFGGMPPKSAMSLYQGNTVSDVSEPSQVTPGTAEVMQVTKVEPTDYRYIFNACGVGMAIASMGGAFIDCNQLFCQLSNYTKQELCALTIFNLTSRQDLQPAFDLISQMISPPMDARSQDSSKLIVLRGAMKNRHDLGLSIALVKEDDGIAKCFCVTLIKNPSSPFDVSKPIPVSFESIQKTPLASKFEKDRPLHSAPTFTSG